MAHYTYKCVPVPTIVNTGQVGKDSHSAAVMTYEKIINNAANDGWELVQVDTITSVQNPGCLGGLFGKKSEEANFKLLIFKKHN